MACFGPLRPEKNIKKLVINSGPFFPLRGRAGRLPFCWPCMRAEEGKNLWWIWRQDCRSLQQRQRQQARWQQPPLNLMLLLTGSLTRPNSCHSIRHWHCNLKGAWEHKPTSEFARAIYTTQVCSVCFAQINELGDESVLFVITFYY